MPTALDSADRKLLLIAGAVLLLLMAAIAFEEPGGQTSPEGDSVPSTYYSSAGGARAAYLLLQQMHFGVQRWERSPVELPEDPAGTILILADPEELPSAEEGQALRSFVLNGGQVLFTGAQIQRFFSDDFAGAKITEFGSEGPAQSYDANLPSALTRGAKSVSIQAEAELDELLPTQTALYSDADSAVVVSWRLGAGRILWWAGPTPLTNAGISQAGNLNLFLDAMNVRASDATDPDDAAPTQIYWDEYFHGERSSLWSYMQNTPVAWGLLQLGVLAAGVLFTFSRRSGPTAIPATVSRLSPLEFVDTLGGLYERAKAEPAVVGIVYQQFRMKLTRQLRLSALVDEATLASAIRARLGREFSDLPNVLRRAAGASHEKKITPAAALALIQELEHYEVLLGMKKAGPEEKS
jgi:uncharacterized protein DUF4350